MRLTFIEGYRTLAKTFTPEGTHAYPLIKKVTSHEYVIPETAAGLREKTDILRKHAAQGHAMMKGPFIRPLENETRSGLTDNTATTNNIVIDIDGLTLRGHPVNPALTKAALQTLAEACVKLLPDVFQDVCYIVHASSSLGLKGDKVSMHLDFMLGEPLPADTLKRWLQVMNLTLPVFTNQLELTATGNALRYKLDVSLADNSRIIYIAPPVFQDVTDPIPNPDDRIFLVERGALAVTVPDSVKKLRKSAVTKELADKVEALREQAGLAKRAMHTRQFIVEGEAYTVVTNPDGCSLTYVRDTDNYVYYNINGGDSNAYYVRKLHPYVVHNFKGEPAFLFEHADPATYQWHIDTYIRGNAEAEARLAPTPVVFNDVRTDLYYRGTIDRIKNTVISMNTCGRQSLEDWMVQHQADMPDNVPVFNYEFDPTDQRTVDLPQRFINRYQPTPVMSNPPEIDERYVGLNYNTWVEAETLCPNIFKVIRSVTGDSHREMGHFINWLAYIIQEKKKTQTAWVLHGVEGTGKGILFERVLRPIFGAKYAVQINMSTLEDGFNGWLEEALIVMVDEFQFSTAKNRQAVLNTLKNYITEPTAWVRAMRTNGLSIPNFSNWILCGNERDMMRPGDEDRRYNIAPRQDTKLLNRYPELVGNLDVLNDEAPAFAAMLMTFKYRETAVREAIDNDAKNNMRASARTVVEDFIQALRVGDLDFFLDIMHRSDTMDVDPNLPAAKNVVRGIVRNLEPGKGYLLTVSNTLSLFKVLVGDSKMAPTAFGKLLGRAGMHSERVRVNGAQDRYLNIPFTHPDIEQLRQDYLLEPHQPKNVVDFPARAP
jgi:hypothetical protein